MEDKIKNKLYYSIKEVGEIVGVRTSTLRFWEKHFKILKPPRTDTKRRRYTKKDLEIAILINDILHNKGMKISGAKAIIRESELRKKLKEHGSLSDIKDEIIVIKDEINSVIKNLHKLKTSINENQE
jgi:DNA-binding transcriptional MerR regulator